MARLSGKRHVSALRCPCKRSGWQTWKTSRQPNAPSQCSAPAPAEPVPELLIRTSSGRWSALIEKVIFWGRVRSGIVGIDADRARQSHKFPLRSRALLAWLTRQGPSGFAKNRRVSATRRFLLLVLGLRGVGRGSATLRIPYL